MRTNTDSQPSLPVPNSCIEITKGDQIIPLETRVHHLQKLGIERFHHEEFKYFSPSIHKDQRNNTQCIGDSQSHDTLVDSCEFSNHRNQSVGDGDSHSFKMPLRTAEPVQKTPRIAYYRERLKQKDTIPRIPNSLYRIIVYTEQDFRFLLPKIIYFFPHISNAIST